MRMPPLLLLLLRVLWPHAAATAQLLVGSGSTTFKTPHHHHQPPTKLWTPRPVPGCVDESAFEGQIFAVEMRAAKYDLVWERQLRFSQYPTEIQTRVRCTEWPALHDPTSSASQDGRPGPVPPQPRPYRPRLSNVTTSSHNPGA